MTLIAVPLSSLVKSNVSLNTIFQSHRQHKCSVTVPYGLFVLGLTEFPALASAFLACAFAINISRHKTTDTTAGGEGHQMVAMIPADQPAARSYVDPVRPGYSKVSKDDPENSGLA